MNFGNAFFKLMAGSKITHVGGNGYLLLNEDGDIIHYDLQGAIGVKWQPDHDDITRTDWEVPCDKYGIMLLAGKFNARLLLHPNGSTWEFRSMRHAQEFKTEWLHDDVISGAEVVKL